METRYKYANFSDHQQSNSATSQGITTAYGQAAIRSELDLINNQKSLYDGARRLGQLVAAHQIDEAQLIQTLYSQADLQSIDRANHHITRGLEHGKKKPRVIKAHKDYKGSHEWAKDRKMEIQEYVEVFLGDPQVFGSIKPTDMKIILSLCLQMQKAGCTKIKAASGYVAMNAGVDLDTVYTLVRSGRLAEYGFEVQTSEIPGQKTSWHLKASKMVKACLSRTEPSAAKQILGLRPAMGPVLANSFNDKTSLFYPGHNAWGRHHNAYKLFLLLASEDQVALRDLKSSVSMHEDTVRSELKYLVEIGAAELAEILEASRGKPKFYRLSKSQLTESEEYDHSIIDRRSKTVARMQKSRDALTKWREAYQENRKRTQEILKRRSSHKEDLKKTKGILEKTEPKRDIRWDLLRLATEPDPSQGINVSQNNLQ